ncbi:MAG: redox-regulated ATPase YchF, partial [Deltaproteobacteria bacterium]|nr:redox-regulated ATPase YchF [Deltaproteobacteria bacterium]
MKLGIIGLPQSGRSTIFSALTGARGDEEAIASHRDQMRGMVKVLDQRINYLSAVYKPKKTIYAVVEYLLPSDSATGSESITWNQARACDAFIHVVRNFPGAGGIAPKSEEDYRNLEDEMIINDLSVAEKRVERIELDLKRGKKEDENEYSLIKKSRELLESGRPLREKPELSNAPELKGFTFLSAKPEIIIVNNDDDNELLPEWESMTDNIERLAVRGRL